MGEGRFWFEEVVFSVKDTTGNLLRIRVPATKGGGGGGGSEKSGSGSLA